MSASAVVPEVPKGGFSFDNFARNEYMGKKGFPIPKAIKTGTTIAGIIWDGGVILGADTRATSDTIVADKKCEKIHYLAPNMYCCGAGTAADCDFTTRSISSQVELHQLNTGKIVPVNVAVRLLKQHLFKYQGHVGAALVLGGVDASGPKLYTIAPHGSTDMLPFVTMGSGSLAAMAVFESRWKPGMRLEEGKQLVRDAIAAGVFNDLGSGSNIDLCVITKMGGRMSQVSSGMVESQVSGMTVSSGVESSGMTVSSGVESSWEPTKVNVDYMRPYDEANLKGTRSGDYSFKIGATSILTSTVIPLIVEDVMVRHVVNEHDVEQMDTSA